MQQPTNGVAATACTTSSDADGASTGKKASDAAGGGPAVSELPLHLTEKVLCHMSLMDSARLATVCKSWAATVSAMLATSPAPQLYVCMPPDNKSDRRGLVASVALDGGARHRPTPAATIPARVRSSDTNGLRCVGATPSGRVAFAAGWHSETVVLVNPITGARQSIRVGSSHLDHSRVLAAAGAGGGGDALFAVDGSTRVLWRQAPGGGEEWSKCAVGPTLHQDASNPPISSAINCNGCCYYLLHNDGSLSTVDATKSPPLRMEKLPVARVTKPLGAFHVSGHLVESDGEVLFVQQLVDCSDDECLSVSGFEVHRLDVKGQRWTKVNQLAGDRALFVSQGSSFAVRASDTAGCRRNCIYFVGKKQYYSNHGPCHATFGSTWGVYSMEQRRVLFEHAVTGPGPASEAIWFLPRVA